VIVPEPVPGLVIAYSYLWLREAETGQEEGRKDRPCAIILVSTEVAKRKIVRVLPITHSPPADPTEAIAIPIETKKRLGLDSEPSWIMISELNEFTWPGPDLRPIAGADRTAYGFLPPRFFNFVREKYIELHNTRRSKTVPRT
jgi:hypothetical protein